MTPITTRCIFFVFALAVVYSQPINASDESQNLSPTVVQGYDIEIGQLNRSIVGLQSMADKQSTSWIHQERLAKAYLARAQLGGKIQDYLAAKKSINHAFELTGGHGGPVLTRAAINYSMHRLDAIEADLSKADKAILIDSETAASILALRADVLFSTGRYLAAKELYDADEKAQQSPVTAIKMAFYYSATAVDELAEHWFGVAVERMHRSPAQLQSWIQMQQGIFDLGRGRWHEAGVHYQQAQELFSGHWLVEEHIAEIEALLGNTSKAEALYRDLIQRTNSPIFMASLAEILAAKDSAKDHEEADQWIQKATTEFKNIMKVAPELMSGHALDFFLQKADTELALALAKENYRLRPAGAAAVSFAQALALHGDSAQSIAILESELMTPYRSPELHASAYVLYALEGQVEKAAQQRALATQLNPVAVEDIDWLVRRLEVSKSE